MPDAPKVSGPRLLLPFCSLKLKAALLFLGMLAAGLASAQTALVSVTPDADAFVWSLAPTNNYGGGGALSVSGSAAVNGSGQQNGLFDTLMRFPFSNVVTSLDSTLGSGNWMVTRVRLLLYETAAPDNSIFNRGVGAFEVFHLTSDNWVEGTGRPIAPTTDGVTWNDLSGLVNSNLDASLGIYTNAGVEGPIAFTLALAAPLVADIRQGEEAGLHLTAASPTVGFTFNSRNFSNTNAQPMLEVTAAVAPVPRIDGIVLAGGGVSVTFGTEPNWAYTLQGSDTLATSRPGHWTNLLLVPAQPVSGNATYLDGITNRQRFYRLSVSP